MGHRATAVCSSCNYEADYTVGGSRSNFHKVAMFPVSCSVCRELSSANFKDRPLKCEKCGSLDVTSYTAANMSKGDGRYTSEMCFDLKLDDGHYRCPKCGEFCLRFAVRMGMFFD